MSNCHIEAESHFRSGDAEWICFRKTRMSRLARWHHTAPVTVRVLVKLLQVLVFFPIGYSIRSISGLLMHVSEFFLSGGWLHGSWITFNGEHWEYVPLGKCDPRWVPPILFDGQNRKVDRE